MRIAIDGRTIVTNRTGVGVYADRLVRSLLELDHTNEYTLFLVEDNPTLQAPNLLKVMITGYTRMGPNRFWENILLPSYLKKHKIDIFFSPAYVLPILRGSRTSSGATRTPKFVVTLHDLVAYVYPETFTLKMKLWQHLYVGNAVRTADRILADSEATKRDILKYYEIPEHLIDVVHLAVGERFKPLRDPRRLEEVRKRYNLPVNFILYVGTLEPRKNVARLAKAYSLLPEDVMSRYSLVLAGAPGWFSSGIVEAIEALNLGDRIRRIGYVDLEDLPAIYSLATTFAYLSLYEGFGAPPLEAMACGTPVICSKTSSLPEVVGDAGVLVDPFDINQIKAQLQRLLEDPAWRKQLSEAGIERAKKFNGLEMAGKVLKIFEELNETTLR
jgi:glycosyltransferase involved in cell wall biosynthesis